MRKKKVILDLLRRSRVPLAAAVCSGLCASAVYCLYGLPLEPVMYAAFLTVIIYIVSFAAVYVIELTKAGKRDRMICGALAELMLPKADSLMEEDYQLVICKLKDELEALRTRYEFQRHEEVDYYTAWVHQIKTPLAVMRMELGGDESERGRILHTELFRMEQYVDMVLQYIRLDGGSDLVIKEYPLDELIRESVRKYAPMFISKHLNLNFDGTDRKVITDKKWFSCILDQLLSNAIKYTPSGGITLSLHDSLLSVSDTGIGIAVEDVPRIFEKGFTGENGRVEKRSSGLGLYLCRKAADLLTIPLKLESAIGKGSVFTLDLSGKIR